MEKNRYLHNYKKIEFYQIDFYFIEAAVDLDRISREVDVDVLQDNIEQLTFCNIDNEIVIFNHWFVFVFLI